MKHYQKNNGFTLIELLVVVLIIGILSAIALPQYTMAVEKARLTEALQNIRMIEEQMKLYLLENPGTGRVYFKDFASVDPSWNWSEEWEAFWTEYFYYYDPYISNGELYIEVGRESDENYYKLYVRGSPDSPIHECYTGTTDFGHKMCRQLESQGWTYVDADF